MESVNNFSGGINQDLSKLMLQPNQCQYVLNMRPVTELGNSTGSLEAIRGNQLELSIPNIWNVYKLRVTTTSAVFINTTITIMGNVTSVFGVNSSSTGEDLYNQINSLPGFDTTWFAAYNDTDLVIWSTSDVSAVDPNVTFTGAAISYVTNNGSANVYLPAITSMFPIGNTFIRDKFYLYTCNNNLANPGGQDPDLPTDPSQLGQIWELTYDYTEPTTTNTSIRLIYHNYLDFTRQHGIPPTATEGRFENPATQRIYWSDNFNTIRTLNVANENAMALDPSLIDIFPSLDFSIPILDNVGVGGNLKAGIYQLAYRLKNAGGSITAFSIPSNLVQIAGPGIGDNTVLNEDQYRQYIGATQGTTINKNITWTIKDLDTDFEFIELVVLRRESLTDVPDIYVVYETTAPASGDFEYTYTGNEDTFSISLDEFTALGATFSHCKTMATKDNILFLGNVRNVTTDLDFDTRAYRFLQNTTNFTLNDDQGNSQSYPGSTTGYASVPETADAINPNQDTHKYKYNSNTIGGSGPNISYEFGTVLVPADMFPNWGNLSVGGADAGYKHVGNSVHQNAGASISSLTTLDFLNVLYGDNTTVQSYNNPINNGNKMFSTVNLMKGYKRNEIYRFALQAYNKQKTPYFAKWIADIKMPDFDDTNANPIFYDGTSAAAAVTDFRTSVVYSGQCYVCQLYVKFEVNIPANLTNQIGGYSIVRCERKKDDMTIGGQALLVGFESIGAGTDREVPGAIRFPYLHCNAGNNPYGMLLCPDWLLDPGLYHGYNTSDTLRLVQAVTSAGTYTLAFNLTTQPYYQIKYYNSDPTTGTYASIGQSYPLSSIQYFSFNGTITDSGINFYNQSNGNGAARDPADIQSDGSPCHWVKLSGANFPFNQIGSGTAKFIVDIVRAGVVQYGGNSYADRSRSEYILTGHFRPVAASPTALTDDFAVLGGDTWINIMDHQKLIKNWAGEGNSSGNKYSVTAYFPVETRVNIPMRQGNYVSYNLLADDSNGASGTEDFVYNNVYNNENDVIKFFPKPLLFNETDHWDNRVVYSSVKINGETSDSWTQFAPLNYYDVEGSYGPINAIITLSGYDLYYVQDRGFGRLLINPTVVDTTEDIGVPTVLGTGKVIQTGTYIATDAGSKHQWSVTKSNQSILFVDAQKNKVYKYAGQLGAISDVHGMKSFLNKELLRDIVSNDTPLNNKGIVATYDFENSEYLITFLNQNTNPEYVKYSTVVYNELTDRFTSFYSFTPHIYINNNQKYFTMGDTNESELYLHNRGDIGRFYGTNYPFRMRLVFNHNPQYTKVLDNLLWHTEAISDTNYPVDTDNVNIFDATWNQIRIYNDYQNTDYVTLDPTVTQNIRRVERGWQLQIPRNRVLYSTTASPNIFTDLGNKTYGERLRDKTFTIELEYSNVSNYRFIMHFLKSFYRISPR
jgi:hypothetical protein